MADEVQAVFIVAVEIHIQRVFVVVEVLNQTCRNQLSQCDIQQLGAGNPRCHHRLARIKLVEHIIPGQLVARVAVGEPVFDDVADTPQRRR
ncbi:Uncharacterised protein [Klebsiella pneumoniae]|nr:Uncharacterised protein [Klebsiella pneumoniae]